MQFRLLGKSGTAESELCLGTMTCGSVTCESDATTMIHRFLDAGGNFLDTTNLYVGGRSQAGTYLGAYYANTRNINNIGQSGDIW